MIKYLANYNDGIVCLSEWIQEYYQQYPDSTNLQAEIDEFMAKFDENKEQVCIMPGVMLTSDQSFLKKKPMTSKFFNFF